MEIEELLPAKRNKDGIQANAAADDADMTPAGTNDAADHNVNENTDGSMSITVEDGNDTPAHEVVDTPDTTKGRNQVCSCRACLQKTTPCCVFGVAVLVAVAVAAAAAVVARYWPWTPSQSNVTVSSVGYGNSTRSSLIFSSSICYNDVMRGACSGGSLTDSLMQLLCSLLTCSVSVDPMAASQGANYQQFCKSIHTHGIKGMDYVCHTCLGYNGSDRTASEFMANDCLFLPAILQYSYTHDGTSAWLALRSNDPERWVNSSYCLSTYARQLLGLAASTSYDPYSSALKSSDFVKPICNSDKQCFDIIQLNTSDAGEGPPSVCDPDEVLSRAANKSCVSTKDWLGKWLNCCP